MDDEDGCAAIIVTAFVVAIIIGILVAIFAGSNTPDKPTVQIVKSVDEIQGKWKVVEATDPNGNGFEAKDIEIVIKGNSATSQDAPLRLEFAADGSYMKMYATINGAEKQVGEVSVEITTQANPVQMVWMDRTNSKQVTLLEKQ